MRSTPSAHCVFVARFRWARFEGVGHVAGVAIALMLAGPTSAQGTGNGFLFKEPVGSFGLYGGFAQARAGSDIFSFITDELTLGHGDFGGAAFGAELAFRLRPRLELAFRTSYAGRNAQSEFRDFVDNNDLPIEQSTSLARLPITASAKLYLADRGRSIGRFAWIPARFAPFVGVGAGAMWYRFRQQGDFIDMSTLAVFPDKFESSGWTPAATGFAGMDMSLGPRFGLTGEAVYSWARAPMSRDFSGFHRIDLSGYDGSLGLYVRF
jgi:hypothetical protein